MSLHPPQVAVPVAVNQYLLPSERQVMTLRRHPVVLLGPIILVLIALAAAGNLTTSSAVSPAIVWGAFLVILLYFLRQTAAWVVTYFAVTNERMLLIRGTFIRSVSTIPLSKVTDLSFQRSAAGRLLGYGTLIIKASGKRQPFPRIRHVPYPQHLYLEIFSLLLPHGGPERPCPTCGGRGTIPQDSVGPAQQEAEDW